MRLLYVAMKYDYGKPERGYSFEHYNFFDYLRHAADELLYFDFMSLLNRDGRTQMNSRLLEVVKAEKPDVMFTVLFNDELDRNTIRRISDSHTTTINWFCDDHWRFENFSKAWAPSFNWVITTAESAVPKYAAIGYPNVIKSQWACNPYLYRKTVQPLLYDVSFVGQPHGNRRSVIEYLRNRGISVHTFGVGWKNGRISQERMIEVFNQSRINLNLSNASVSRSGLLGTVDRIAPAVAGVMKRFPGGTTLMETVGGLIRRAASTEPTDDHGAVMYAEQIKGRNFEVPGCGGFLLTAPGENLSRYYEPGEEVACFESLPNLAERIRYYLAHEAERAAVAQAGYRRTMLEHTYQHRFREIFTRAGIQSSMLNRDTPGAAAVTEII